MMSIVEEYEKKIVKSDEYIKHLDDMITQYTQLKAENVLDRNLWVNKLREEKEKGEMMKEDKPPIKEDPLFNFKASKQLKHNELDELEFYNRSFEINVVDVKVGDYIKVYSKKEVIIGRVKRMTAKTFFINPIVCNDANNCHTFNFMVGINNQHLDSIYNYYFINVIDNHNITNEEIKVLIKNVDGSSGKIKKVDKNFIKKIVWDFGN
jgi:hypothetical protein